MSTKAPHSSRGLLTSTEEGKRQVEHEDTASCLLAETPHLVSDRMSPDIPFLLRLADPKTICHSLSRVHNIELIQLKTWLLQCRLSESLDIKIYYDSARSPKRIQNQFPHCTKTDWRCF